VIAVLLAVAALATAAPATAGDWTRFGFDAARSSSGPAATGITAANVGTLHRQVVQLAGTVDSSPIYLAGVRAGGGTHDVLFVTTTYGRTEAIDASTGTILWRFTPPSYAKLARTSQFTTATPVADPGRAWIYASSPDGRIWKLAVADGHAAWSVSITKLPSREKIAAALNFANGRVIATTGGYFGDAPPYQGHVAVIDAASGRLLHVWNSLCSNRTGLIVPSSCPESDSAIWGRAGAVVEPGTGNLLVATGNGKWDGRTYWGDSTLRLAPDASRLLGAWTPTNEAQLNSSDADLGSTSPALLGGGLAAQGGKDGKLRLLDLTRMAPAGRKGGELQTVSTPGGAPLFTAPAVWRAAGRTWLFVGDNSGLEAWTLSGRRLRPAWSARNASTSPIVAGGLLYAYNPAGGLRVYQATTGKLLATLESGAGHWNSPIVADGRIVLPEGNANDTRTSGVLDIWRR
jgi:outer membrane protein assembly factor BamB